MQMPGKPRRIISRVLRCIRALRSIVDGLHSHSRQRGAELPSLPRRVWEQGRLLLVSGLTPTNYYRYRLYRRELSWEEKAAFVGFFEGWRWQAAVNTRGAGILVSDKVIQSGLLAAHGIPHAKCIGVFGLPKSPMHSYSKERAKVELERFLASPGRENFFLKPVYGHGGAGAISVGRCLRKASEWELLPRKRSVTGAELAQRVADAEEAYLAQERLEPHADLGCFRSDVLHTIRFITVLDGDFEIAQAALKIGVGVGPADNTMKGNAIAGIDVATGILGPGLMMEEVGGIAVPTPCDLHPTTKKRIRGHRIPMWEETVEMIEKAASVFHLHSVLAWDVAVTSQGPVIIEANTDPDLFLTQMPNDEGLLARARKG